MATPAKIALQEARLLFSLSMEGGVVSPERVAGVLEYVEKHRPASPTAVLKAYHRLIAAELAKSEAVIEHAGSIGEPVLAAIAAVMSKRYDRKVTAKAKPNPELLAGMRVRIGDDVYESSVAAQLAALAASV
jgi:F-type H+-transporting ATPase subunit delta